jgi:bud emergence protein 1
MKSIRRSLNKDKEKTDRISSPSNFVVGTAPPLPITMPSSSSVPSSRTAPKRVIRAKIAYTARSPAELSFEAGDFFHVVAEPVPGPEGDEWYDAANPASGYRGLVPASCFQVLGKTVDDSRGLPGRSNGAVTVLGPGQGPGATKATTPNTPTFPFQATPPLEISKSAPSSATSSATSAASQPSKAPSLYGVVQYDFEAQRADELDAKKGEPIIIM